MRHSIMVPDWIWDGYGRSPSAMRDTLARVLAEGGDAPFRTAAQGAADGDPGTVITLRHWTRCNGCQADLDEGARGLLRREADGAKRIYCRECAGGL